VLPGSWAGLSRLEEARLSGPFLADDLLRQFKALPALRRVMLPDDAAWRSDGSWLNAERAKNGLEPIDFRFEKPDADAEPNTIWWQDWPGK
jgi:hypothetical protein